MFEGGWDADAEAYRPAAIAGTWRQMEALLESRIASLTHALIVLARPRDLLLTAEQRKELWRAFRVPVFEQIIGENGALLAAECEAHAGLHIESPKLELAGRAIEQSPCGCGRNTSRVTGRPRIGVESQIQETRTVAAHSR